MLSGLCLTGKCHIWGRPSAFQVKISGGIGEGGAWIHRILWENGRDPGVMPRSRGSSARCRASPGKDARGESETGGRVMSDAIALRTRNRTVGTSASGGRLRPDRRHRHPARNARQGRQAEGACRSTSPRAVPECATGPARATAPETRPRAWSAWAPRRRGRLSLRVPARSGESPRLPRNEPALADSGRMDVAEPACRTDGATVPFGKHGPHPPGRKVAATACVPERT